MLPLNHRGDKCQVGIYKKTEWNYNLHPSQISLSCLPFSPSELREAKRIVETQSFCVIFFSPFHFIDTPGSLDSKLRLILQPQKTTAQKYNSYQNWNEAFGEIYVIASLHCEQLSLLQCWQSLEAWYIKIGNSGIRIKSNKDALRSLFLYLHP
jgi:hypothetical protein